MAPLVFLLERPASNCFQERRSRRLENLSLERIRVLQYSLGSNSAESFTDSLYDRPALGLCFGTAPLPQAPIDSNHCSNGSRSEAWSANCGQHKQKTTELEEQTKGNAAKSLFRGVARKQNISINTSSIYSPGGGRQRLADAFEIATTEVKLSVLVQPASSVKLADVSASLGASGCPCRH